MIYKPKTVKNITDKVIEVRYNNRVEEVFSPGEKKIVDGTLANHIITSMEKSFVECNESVPEDEKIKEVEEIRVAEENEVGVYEEWNWTDLKKEASKRNLFRHGMKKKEVIEVLYASE